MDKQRSKKFVAILLTLAMMVSLLPAMTPTAYAASGTHLKRVALNIATWSDVPGWVDGSVEAGYEPYSVSNDSLYAIKASTGEIHFRTITATAWGNIDELIYSPGAAIPDGYQPLGVMYIYPFVMNSTNGNVMRQVVAAYNIQGEGFDFSVLIPDGYAPLGGYQTEMHPAIVIKNNATGQIRTRLMTESAYSSDIGTFPAVPAGYTYAGLGYESGIIYMYAFGSDAPVNTVPTFVGATVSLTVSQDAAATNVKDLLHASDLDSSQTLTWSQATGGAPSHGTLNFSGSTANSGSTDITPGGTITYTPTGGYSGSDSFTVQVSDGTASATRTINVTVTPAPSSDATLKAASTVKGQAVTGLGTPNAALGSETAGTVTITAAKAADTSNGGSFITLFDRNEGNATVKVVKYATGTSTANFATDAAYANQAITNNDFFIIKVTAQDGTTVNYYRINVTVTTAPSITTQAATSVGTTTATGNGNVTSLGVPNPTAHGVCWNTTGNPTILHSTADNGAKDSTGAFTASMTGLTPNTTYYVRAYATNAADTTYGTQISFTTSGVAPTASTDAASGVSATGATLNGTVNANNDSTTVNFEYGLTNSYGSTVAADQSPVTGMANTSVSKAITGLSPNTTYHYRAVGVNGTGTTNGNDQTFITSAVSPTTTTGAASGVGATGATLNGTVNANNASTTVTFEYGLTTAYGSAITTDQSPVTGTANTSVSKAITGLQPNTMYHYRVKGTNIGGITNGIDQTFTTSGVAPTASTDAASGVSATGATLNGTVNANNDSTTVNFEYGLTNSYGSTVAADQSPVTGMANTSVSKAITGLSPNTTYHYRAVGVNGTGTTNGNDQTFITSAVSPTTTTGAASGVGATGATLNGMVNANNASTTVTFEYGLTIAYGSAITADQSPVTGTAGTSVTKTITGLLPNSTYHFRVVGVNTGGATNGSDQTFTTSALAPTASTNTASGLSTTGATLNGTVNANNASTTVTFQYGITTAYGTTVTAVPSPVTGTDNTLVSKAITGLTPNTMYHYRVIGVNGTGTTNGSDQTFTTTAAGTSTGGGGGGSSTPAQPNPGVVKVIVNGKDQSVGNETKATEDGKSTVTIGVNNKAIESKIDEAIKNNTTGTGNVIQVPVTDTKSEVAKVEFTGDTVKKLEKSAFDVSIKRDNVEYIIAAEEFTISKVAEKLGIQEKDLDDIKVEVKITKLDEKVVKKYNEVAKANGAELVFPPVEFEITAKTIKTNGTTQVQAINKFSNYVERVMEIPAGVKPSKITTGIVFNQDGTYSHVPTDVYQKNGKWYARLNSLTNSNYSVVWNPVTVKSVENHWAKETVNDMASRLIIFNSESFDPDKAITREDFAEYIVRALGIYREGSIHGNKYKDVSGTGEKALAVLTASEYGIVTGYLDETFRPDQQITREEAMVMYQKAMKITKLEGADKTRYLSYTDREKVSVWAEKAVNEVLSAHVFNGAGTTTISPKANLTYAEAAQAIKNLLVESKLINK